MIAALKRDVSRRVRRAFAEQTGSPAADIKNKHTIAGDCGLDSLDGVELVMAIEDEFAIEISDEQATACKTVQDVIDLVVRRKS